MADVTKFLMTDETGQSIAAAINAINPNDAVRYSAQTLTDAQKAQARSNIGAISEDEVDVSTKADKVDGATNGNLAGLDSNGNLTDSTIPASDVTQLKNDLTELSATISDAWNASTTYSVGDYCIYGNQLWKCLAQNSGQAPAEGTYWHQTSVFGEMIKETTIYNETTDSSGLINIGLLTNSYTVISASSEDKVVNILKSSGGYWCVHLMQAWDCQPVKNTLISEVKVQYKNK